MKPSSSATTAVAMGIFLWAMPSPSPAQTSQLSPQAKRIIEELETKFDIELVHQGFDFQPEKTKISGEMSTDIEPYLALLASELRRYPPELVRNSRVKKIVLCEKLAYAKQLRAAVPGFGSGIMYYDVKRGGSNKLYQRSVFHHEFFHQIDFADDGKVYVDQEWSQLNAPDFEYGDGGQNVQDDSQQGVTYNRPGFMNRYSTQGVEEDKAEIYAYLLTRPKVMAKRLSSDPIVAAKVRMMKRLVKSFCEPVGDEFWQSKPVNRPKSK